MKTSILLISVVSVLAPPMAFAEPTAEQIAWLKKNVIPFNSAQPSDKWEDLMPLKGLIGNARVVSLGEATHGTREFFQMKHRITQFLANEMGFTIFAIEANMPEAHKINDFVLRGEGDPKELIAGMYFWTWNTQELLDLILWMREFNKSGKRRIEFTGFDMQTPNVAAQIALDFLKSVDPDYYATAKPIFDDAVKTNPQARIPHAPAIAEVLPRFSREFQHIESSRDKYLKSKPAHEVDWAIQNARIVQQCMQSTANAVSRDESMALNVKWILDHAAPNAKIILWAHNGHVAKMPWWMGKHLERFYEKEMVVIGFTANEGQFTAWDPKNNRLSSTNEMIKGPDGSIEHALHAADLPQFILDLRKCSRENPDSAWITKLMKMRSIGAVADENQFYELDFSRHYDLLIYFDKTHATHCFWGR